MDGKSNLTKISAEISDKMAVQVYRLGKKAPLGRSFNSGRWFFHRSLPSCALLALVLLGQWHEGLPLADSVLPRAASLRTQISSSTGARSLQ